MFGLITLFVVACNERGTHAPPSAPDGGAAVMQYAQMNGGSAVVGGRQYNWAVSGGSFMYGAWIYAEMNQQNSAWFKILGGRNGQGLVDGTVEIVGSVDGQTVNMMKPITYGSNPPPVTPPTCTVDTDTDGDGIDDCSNMCPSGTNNAANDGCRFTNHGNGTVTDTDTSLMWEQTPLSNLHAHSWNAAKDACADSILAGGGWQLATKVDWQGLTGGTTNGTWRLSIGHPFTIQNVAYWTSTEVPPGGSWIRPTATAS